MKSSAFFLAASLWLGFSFVTCKSPTIGAIVIGDSIALGGFSGSDSLGGGAVKSELGAKASSVLDTVFFDELKIENWYSEFVRHFLDVETSALKRLANRFAGGNDKTPIYYVAHPQADPILFNPEVVAAEKKARDLYIWIAIPPLCSAENSRQGLANLEQRIYSWIESYASEKARVVIIPPFRPENWLQNKLVKSKRNFLGRTSTCNGLRKSNLYFQLDELDRSTQFEIPPSYGYCPTVFDETTGIVADYQKQQKKFLQKIKKNLAEVKPDLNIVLLQTPKFRAEQVGPDCFHLNEAGHGRVFRSMLKRF